MFNNWHKKEKPVFTGVTRGLGGFGFGGGGGGANKMEASGGTTFEPGDGFKYHIFTSSSSPGFAVSIAGPGEVEYVIVGGGGGGGVRTGGGGGAGGFRSGTSTGLSATAYPIVVGAAGAGRPISLPGPYTGGVGGHSTFNSIRSEGGGGGVGPTRPANGAKGASGGGGGYTSTTAGVGNRQADTDTPVPSQGNPGGTGGLDGPGYHPSWGGGGGGAGAAGSNGSPPGGGGAGGVGSAGGSPGNGNGGPRATYYQIKATTIYCYLVWPFYLSWHSPLHDG